MGIKDSLERRIGRYFKDSIEINLEEDETIIEKETFKNRYDLEKFSGNNVEIIRNSAFSGCIQLKKVSLLQVKTIESNAFEGCESLENINFIQVEMLGDNVFDGCKRLMRAYIPNISTLGANVFKGCKKLKSIVVGGEGQVDLLKNALKTCGLKQQIDIYVGEEVNCSINKKDKKEVEESNGSDGILKMDTDDSWILMRDKLKGEGKPIKIILGNRVTEIFEDEFKDAEILQEISFDSVKVIKREAFAGCKNLETVDLSKVERIYAGAFKGCEKLKRINLSSLKLMEAGAFSNCTELILVESLAEGDINIGERAFEGCKELKNIDLSKVKGIGAHAFKGCFELSSLNLSSIERIGERAFENCENLEAAIIPNIRELGDYAFKGCNKLRKIVVKTEEQVEMVRNTFWSCEFRQHVDVLIGEAETSIYDIEIVEFEKGCRVIRITDIEELNRKEKEIKSIKEPIKIEFGKEITELSVRLSSFYDNLKIIKLSAVERIGERAFGSCRNLTSVEGMKESNCTKIDESAFNYCDNLKDIDLSGVKKIGKEAFCTCSKLEEIDLSSVEVIGEEAFNSCWNLTTVKGLEQNSGIIIKYNTFSSCRRLKDIDLSKVRSIGERAFEHCYGLTSIDLSSIEEIKGCAAFSDCTNLNKVTVGNEDQARYVAKRLERAGLKQQIDIYVGGKVKYSVNNPDKDYDQDEAEYIDGYKVIRIESKGELNGKLEEMFYEIRPLMVCLCNEITEIPAHAFGENTAGKLCRINLDLVEVIHEEAFSGCMFKEIDFSNIKLIEKMGLSHCRQLTTITNMERSNEIIIGENAFLYCEHLESINLSKVKWIGRGAFYGCEALTTVGCTESSNVVCIGEKAFENCKGLEYIDLSGVQTIGGCAFCNCSNLKGVKLKSINEIGYNVFYGCKELRIIITGNDYQKKMIEENLRESNLEGVSVEIEY